MSVEPQVIFNASFNPRIKGYYFWMGVLFLFFTLIGIPFLIFWILGLGQFWGKRYYQSLECDLTTKHLRYKKGFLFKVEKTIPLENIQDLTFLDNPFLRLFDLRILKIETAGGQSSAGAGGSDMKLMGIIETYDFKEKVLAQREKLMNERSLGVVGAVGGGEGQNEVLDVLKEIRDLLKKA